MPPVSPSPPTWRSPGDGGGIYFHNGTLTIKHGVLTGNKAAGSGATPRLAAAAACIRPAARSRSRAARPAASNTSGRGASWIIPRGKAAASTCPAASLTLNLTHIASNTAIQSGGAIYNGGTVVIANSFVFSNTAGFDGGGIDNTSKLSVLTINYSTFMTIRPVAKAAASATSASATATINTSTIEDSSASLGGDIANSGTLTITASTISSSSASQLGGGIYDDLTGAVNLTNSTIAENTSQAGGGGIYSQGTLQAVNVTIAENLIHGGSAAGWTSRRHRPRSTTRSSTPTRRGGTRPRRQPATASSNNLIGVANADLGPLANNGGPTLTIALLPGSPAIDGGSTPSPVVTVPTTDQRGAVRAAGQRHQRRVDRGHRRLRGQLLLLDHLRRRFVSRSRARCAWA